ncbi:MAG TPA: hypothetical protein ENI42_06770 [Thermoplasmatales archaeon]|nr:hypothetical protein [Thermoplasmatales archaeon]
MEELRDLVPPGFPINNSTEVKVENGTVWVKTRVDLNNWSFPSFEEVLSRSTHKKEMEEMSKELEINQRELDKATKDLEKTMKELEELEKESNKLKRELVNALVSFVILLFVFIVGRILQRSSFGEQ